MNFFNKFFKNKVGGEIAYYGLTNWWNNDLSEEERHIIRTTYLPLGRDRCIDEGSIDFVSQSKLSFLGILAEWFKKKEYYPIAKKILNEGEKIYNLNEDAVDLHYFCLSAIRVHYANRNEDSEALNKAIEYCEKQIAISSKVKPAIKKALHTKELPQHTGYKQLAIIYEKQKLYEKALDITRKALKEGWNKEDCLSRIEKLERKIEKK